MLSIIKTSSTKMEMYLTTPKTFLILHSTISHKILAISHTKKSFQYFLGLFFNLKKNEQIFQAFILYHGPTLTQNMKARCNLGFFAFFLSFNANTYLWEDIHWLKSEIKRQTTFFFFLVDVVILKINCALRPTTKGIHQSLIPTTMLIQPIELRWKNFVTPFYLVTHSILAIDFAHGSFVAQMSWKVLLTSFFIYLYSSLARKVQVEQREVWF